MLRIYLALIKEALEELADRSVQFNRWVNEDHYEFSSFVEVTEQLVDDSWFLIQLEKGGTGLPRRIEAGIVDLGRVMDAIPKDIPDHILIDHPIMDEVRARAALLLAQIRHFETGSDSLPEGL